jgi:hypothetical protein
MALRYEIFWKIPERGAEVKRIGTAKTLKTARVRVQKLALARPGDYFVRDTKTGTIVVRAIQWPGPGGKGR